MESLRGVRKRIAEARETRHQHNLLEESAGTQYSRFVPRGICQAAAQRWYTPTSVSSNGSTSMRIPEGLSARASRSARVREWVEALPGVCAELGYRWSVQLGEPFPDCNISLVLPAEGARLPAVLKIPMPAEIQVGTVAGDFRDREAAALRIWAGEGATELFAHDATTGAMLVERCIPGATLDTIDCPEEADEAAAGVMASLHGPRVGDIDGFERLADRATALAKDLPGRFDELRNPFDSRLLDEAVEILGELSDATAAVLLHGDIHHHNILSAARRSWLAIDPLPMIGEPAYDAVQYLLFRKGDLADPATEWGPVIARFCRLAGVDAERVMAWTFARLVSDAIAACEQGLPTDELEARHGDLWTARLIPR